MRSLGAAASLIHSGVHAHLSWSPGLQPTRPATQGAAMQRPLSCTTFNVLITVFTLPDPHNHARASQCPLNLKY